MPSVAEGDVWQLLTSTFAHVEVWHIGFNMLALYVLGPGLEAAIGRTRFLLLYLISGLAGERHGHVVLRPASASPSVPPARSSG